MSMSDMFKNLGNLKQQMGQIKEAVEKITAEGEAGAGLVKAKSNGGGKLLSVSIDLSLLNEKDQEMVEGLIVSAVNQSIEKAREATENEMKGLMNLPGMDKLFQ